MQSQFDSESLWEIVKAVQSPELQPRLAKEAIDTKSLDAKAFSAFVQAEAERWTPLAKAVAAQVKTGGER